MSQMYMSLKGGERSGDSSPRWQEQISQLAHLIWLRAIVLLDLGTSPTDLKSGKAHLSIFIVSVENKIKGSFIVGIKWLGSTSPTSPESSSEFIPS